MSAKTIFEIFFQKENFVDRFKKTKEDSIDVIIPLINTNILFEKNLFSFYREIPIRRLLIGDGGCTDDSIEIVKKFPRVKIIDQIKYNTLGYCIKELIEKVETAWFVYLHADVYLPEGWYDEMKRYKGKYDFFECKRHFAYLLYNTNDVQFNQKRAFSGSQMGRKEAFKDIIGKIDDDYIMRTEDIFFQQKIEEQGFKYKKIPSAFHIHQVMNKKGEKEPKFKPIIMKREEDEEWSLRTANDSFRAAIKYLSPEIDGNVDLAIVKMYYILKNSPKKYIDIIKWVNKTNPKWVKYISRKVALKKAIGKLKKKLINKLYAHLR